MTIGAPQYRDSEVATLTGARTLTSNDAFLLSLDPGGAGRTITMPADGVGQMCIIKNTADAAEVLTINDAASVLVIAIGQDEAAELWNDGTDWHGSVGTES